MLQLRTVTLLLCHHQADSPNDVTVSFHQVQGFCCAYTCFSIFMAQKEHAPAWLEWSSCGCVYADDHISGTCFSTKLHLYSCLLRQPLITNISTKSTFVALVGKSTNIDSKMTKKKQKKKLSCVFHLPLSPRTGLNVYQNFRVIKADSVLSD